MSPPASGRGAVLVNVASREHKANPFPFYERLRAEAPVYRVTLPTKQDAWLVTRYDDVLQVLKDERFAKDPFNALTPGQTKKLPWMPDFVKPLARNMLDVDDPDHKRLRGLVNVAFSPKLVDGMRQRIQVLTDGLIDGLHGRPGIDLISAYAQPIPTTVIAEMLGVPVADRHKFVRWTQAIVASGATSWGMLWAIPTIWFFMRYLRRLLDQRRRQPRDDLLTALVQAEEAGDRLNADELLAMTFLLLIAGHETTVNLIGNGVLALLENPDQMEKLRVEPGLIKSAVEELLRFASPVETATERYAREDVTIAGVTIPQGALVFAVIASANRDERQFPHPNTLDLAREPNRHLAFGHGVHFCLGAALARMEGQIAIQTLLRRTRKIRLATSKAPRWRKGLVLRGLETLPVSVDWLD